MKVGYIVGLVCFGLGCEYSVEDIIDSTDLEKEEDTLNSSLDNVDRENTVVESYLLADKIITVKPVEEPAVFAGSMKENNENEEFKLKNDQSVNRVSDSLLFRMSNDDFFCLSNIPYDESDDVELTSDYTFQGSACDDRFWNVRGIGYEWHWNILVNRANGDTTLMIGEPFCAPSNNYIISVNCDLDVGYTFNGIELIDLNEDGAKSLGRIEFLDWGVEDMMWVSDSVMLVKQLRLNESYEPFLPGQS